MATERRWQKAQEYERKHWEDKASSIGADQDSLEWYQWRAERLVELITEHTRIKDVQNLSVLEIGSGPVGMISYLPGRERCAIDPLCDYYESQPQLIALRDPAATYVNGGAEQLPYDDGQFSLVIIDNVIDHTQDPDRVLDEMHRVLNPEGVLYLSVNVRTRWGYMMRKLMELFEVDRGHPHSYTQSSIVAQVRGHRFDTVYTKLQDLAEAKRIEKQWGHLRSKVKVLLGLYDIHFETLTHRT